MLQLPLVASKNSSTVISYFWKLVLELQTCCVQLGPFFGCWKTTLSLLGVVTLLISNSIGLKCGMLRGPEKRPIPYCSSCTEPLEGENLYAVIKLINLGPCAPQVKKSLWFTGFELPDVPKNLPYTDGVLHKFTAPNALHKWQFLDKKADMK
jgi:hypothetical protein